MDTINDFMIGVDHLDVSNLTNSNGDPVGVNDVFVYATNDGASSIMVFPDGTKNRLYGVPTTIQRVYSRRVNQRELRANPKLYPVKDAEYFHILLDSHAIIVAEGALTESLYIGKEALKTLSEEAREEIYSLFPELQDPEFSPETACLVPVNSKQNRLIERLVKNSLDFVEAQFLQVE